MTPVEEQKLLTRIAQGDQQALEQLYATYRLRLWRYLWPQLDGNSAWIEEVVQDIFLAVWHSASRYRGEAQVDTWLVRIARHIVANVRRSHYRRVEGHLVKLSDISDGSSGDDLAYGGMSCEDEVVNRLTLIDALHHLSVKHQEVLKLIFYHGFSCDEVAQILAVPAGTVKSRISYARRMLTEELNACSSSEEVDCDR